MAEPRDLGNSANRQTIPVGPPQSAVSPLAGRGLCPLNLAPDTLKVPLSGVPVVVRGGRNPEKDTDLEPLLSTQLDKARYDRWECR